MSWNKALRLVVLLLSIGLATLLSASCKKGAPSPAFIRIAVPYEIQTLDPQAEDKLANFGVLLNVYESLVMADADLKLCPQLAVSWQSPTPLSWIFELRPNVFFHSGKLLRATDVVYSLNRLLLSPELEVRTYAADVTGVQALDDLHVRVTTNRPSPLLLRKLANIMIIQEGAGSDTLTRHTNGTGPYRLTAWSGGTVRLARHEWYWGERPAVPEVEFVLGQGEQQALSGLLAGRFQLAQIDSAVIRQVRASGKYRVEQRDNMYMKHLGCDVARETTPFVRQPRNPFRDLRVRQAVSMAIHRDNLVSQLKEGGVPTTLPVPRLVFGYNPEARAPAYDLQGARKLLAEAGFGGGFSATLLSRRIFGRLPEFVQADLSKVGIRLDIEVLPDPQFFDRLVRGEASLWLNRFSCSTGDAGDFLDDVIHTRDPKGYFGSFNYGRYSRKDLDRAIELSARAEALDARSTAVASTLAAAMADCIVIPLFMDQDIYAIDRSLSWRPRADSYVLAAEITPKARSS